MIISTISLLNIGRGALGLATLIAIAYLFSNNRKAINWSLVAKGIAIQIIFAIGVLKVDFVAQFFETVSHGFVKIISFTDEGVNFLFKSFVTGKIENGLINFVIKILPTVIFFSALTSLFYYWGILQKIVYVFAWIMKKAMRLSGAESLAAAGNIFLGQTEAPLLVKPYIDRMTKSEIMCLMSGGMATIAGGVLAAYIGFLGGDSQAEQILFAKHLLAASVMSAPAAVVAAKIIVPETEKFDTTLHISKEKIGDNALEAITNGTSQGLQLAVNVAGMLLVFIALIAMVNSLLTDVVGHYTGLNNWVASNTDYKEFSLQFILGYIFAPITWLMGVDKEDIFLVGQLLGEKTILNEFVAYVSLGELKEAGAFAHKKSVIMATYILCGFANFASIGIQIGGIGSLAPHKKGLLSRFGFRALVAGTLASLFTAVIVGMLFE
jgi:CNT family concentrative nucleoside transporter